MINNQSNYGYSCSNNFQYDWNWNCYNNDENIGCIEKSCRFSQNYKRECFLPWVNIDTLWQTIPYAGMNTLPIAETPTAGSFPLAFLRRDPNGKFLNPDGSFFDFNVSNPHNTYSIADEFDYLSNVQCNLTYEQIKIAKYWSTGVATKQFTPIADILIDTYGVPPCSASRILYILQGAINDAFVATWYLKYLYNIIRPCQYNQCFKTVVCTPMHPAYPSGHSVSAFCMAEVLSYFFPAEREKLFMLAGQCSDARILAGVHFKMDCEEGSRLGISVGKSVISLISRQVDINNNPVDVIYTENLNADIIPKSLNQYIPYKGPTCCKSLLLNTQYYW
ncbi:phosphatase PAP2 family protein [Paraclostridium dentum]|uniref:phosphatase PAP2 family protein n=1 Tax=Paraclostridium dentum TaxID=2662455 RepID=UPI003F3AF8A7